MSEILGRPAAYRDVTVQAVLPGVRTALARVLGEPIRADLRLESVIEGVLVTGRVTAATTLSCSRCLSDFASDVSLEVCELFADAAREDVDDDAYLLDGLEMNLEPMLRDVVALALPLNPLCRAECAGLCAGCGANLNEAVCACVEEEIDPRWEALDSLRAQLEQS